MPFRRLCRELPPAPLALHPVIQHSLHYLPCFRTLNRSSKLSTMYLPFCIQFVSLVVRKLGLGRSDHGRVFGVQDTLSLCVERFPLLNEHFLAYLHVLKESVIVKASPTMVTFLSFIRFIHLLPHNPKHHKPGYLRCKTYFFFCCFL